MTEKNMEWKDIIKTDSYMDICEIDSNGFQIQPRAITIGELRKKGEAAGFTKDQTEFIIMALSFIHH